MGKEIQKSKKGQELFLETLLKPARYVDEMWLLRNYTKFGMKFGLDEGLKRYKLAFSLNLAYPLLLDNQLFGEYLRTSLGVTFHLNDFIYNMSGIQGAFEKKSFFSENVKNFHKKYNSLVRLPVFLIGAGLITKFGIDVVNNINNQAPLEVMSLFYLKNGLAHLSLASSMYFKEIDKRILDKIPLWKKAWDYLKLNPSLVDVSTKSFPKSLESLTQ